MIKKNQHINRKCKIEDANLRHYTENIHNFYNNFDFLYVFNLNEKNKTCLASFQNNAHISSDLLKIFSPLK